MPRVDPPMAAGEREMLIAFLDYQRESVLIKLDGLDEKTARFVVSPKGNSLASIVQHLGWVERWWFPISFLGEEADVPWSDTDRDADFRVDDDRPIADIVAFYRREWERSNEIVRAAPSLDERGTRIVHPENESPTLRWILNHMIEETARHAGHADITRELIDGSIGD
jgi:uncharacterized protein DUF664